MILEGSYRVLSRYAKNDLRISVKDCNGFADIKLNMIKELRKLSVKELKANKLELETNSHYQELNSMDNFISIRLSFYALVLAIIVFIKEINIEKYISKVLAALVAILISTRYVSDLQKDRILYYRFKLNCIEEILNEKESNVSRKKS